MNRCKALGRDVLIAACRLVLHWINH